MNLVPTTPRFLGKLTRLLKADRGGTSVSPRWTWANRRRALRSLAAFGAFLLIAYLALLAVLDYGPPRFRDPEYGKRLDNVHARAREHPNNPLVLAIGSSRTAMGVRPSVLENSAQSNRPLILNFSLAGSGPVMELMTFRRALADGVRPRAVIIEYWPAFLREDGPYLEESRLEINRLRLVDRPLIQEYFQDPAKTEHAMREQRLNIWFGHRKSIMNQFAPRWLPANQRSSGLWETIDEWGWLPGRQSVTATERTQSLVHTGNYYLPLFAHFQVSPIADRALRQLITEVREHGIPVALFYLPESAEFRAMMTPEAQRISDQHLKTLCQEMTIPLIDGRGWVSDAELADGFHMTWTGAAEFTHKLRPAVESTFPELTR